ncbi:MAG: LUD domain-containing protein [Verrucomicrobiales bacterium]
MSNLRVTPIDRVPDKWSDFEKALNALGGELKSLDDLISLEGSFYVDPDAELFMPHQKSWTKNVWTADFGVTLGCSAVIESGTVVTQSKPGCSRLASLAPPIHILLVPQTELFQNLEDALESRASDRTTVLITGPSRTADIEGVLVRGIHGPKQLWVIPC